MKQISLRTAAIATSAFACAALFSFGWSEQSGVSLSIESAEARVGRPLTPLSGAGVARRTYRRAAYGGVVGAGLGVAAVGTAAAVAATQPWGWGGGPYVGTGYYGGRPYAGAVAARTAYYGGYGPGWGGGSSWGGNWGWGGGPYVGAGYYGARPYVRGVAARTAYYGGYNPSWGGGSYCTPGTRYFGADGRVHICR